MAAAAPSSVPAFGLLRPHASGAAVIVGRFDTVGDPPAVLPGLAQGPGPLGMGHAFPGPPPPPPGPGLPHPCSAAATGARLGCRIRLTRRARLT